MAKYFCPHCGSGKLDTAGNRMNCPMPTHLTYSADSKPINIPMDMFASGYAKGCQATWDKAIKVVENFGKTNGTIFDMAWRNINSILIEALEAAKRRTYDL